MMMLYLAVGVGLALFVLAIAAMIWQVRAGQLDDLDTPALRMLADDPPAHPAPETKPHD